MNLDDVASVYKKWIDSKPFDNLQEYQNSFGALTDETFSHQAKKAA